MKKRYVIGIDFGTLSGRTVLLDAYTGKEIAVAEQGTAQPLRLTEAFRIRLYHNGKSGIYPLEYRFVGIGRIACEIRAPQGLTVCESIAAN